MITDGLHVKFKENIKRQTRNLHFIETLNFGKKLLMQM